MKANNMEKDFKVKTLDLCKRWEMVWQIVANREEWDEQTAWTDYVTIPIEPVGKVDAVLMFADGTIEFHESDEQDAYNWSLYFEGINEQVMTNVIDYINNNY